MRKWTRMPEERSGDYRYSGRAFMTIGVEHELDMEDVLEISTEIRQAVIENGGLDYLQVFEREDGLKVWVIDQLSDTMKESGSYTPEQIEEYDYWTMLLPEEY